jgi:hypothetical protein
MSTEPMSPGRVNTVRLTDTELELARHAMKAYLLAFGHNEADTVEAIKSVIAKLAAARPGDEDDEVVIG